MGYHFNPIHLLRGLQAFFALITLALFGSVSHWINGHSTSTSTSTPGARTIDTVTTTPASIAYPVFTSTLTLLISLPYLMIAPRYFPNLAHKYAMLGIESTTMILWLTSWIAPAAYVGGMSSCQGNACHTARAGIVFGVMEWLLFVVTAVFAGRYCFNAPKIDGYGLRSGSSDSIANIKGLNISRPIPMSCSNGTGTPMPGATTNHTGVKFGGGQTPWKDESMV